MDKDGDRRITKMELYTALKAILNQQQGFSQTQDQPMYNQGGQYRQQGGQYNQQGGQYGQQGGLYRWGRWYRMSWICYTLII